MAGCSAAPGRAERTLATVGVALAAVGLLGGCGLLRAAPSGHSATAGASPTTAVPRTSSSPSASAAATPARPDEAGCVSAAVQVHSGSLGLQAVGEYVFRSLDCGGGSKLGDQLAASSSSGQLQQMASQAGVTMQLQDTAGGTSLSLYADEGTCVVTISERPRAKSLTCA